MFIGEYKHNIDSKRRLAIPAKFRREIGKNVVVAKGLEGSLYLYPLKEWKMLGEKLASLPVGQAQNRDFVRVMLAGASEVEIDGLGRILIPEYLAEHGGLSKNVVIVGLYNRLEIWDEVRWEEYKRKAEKNTESAAEKLGEMGIY